MATSVPRGLSTSEAELFEHLTAHRPAEAALLDDYRRLGESSGAPWVRYLTDLLSEEEVRHHRIFEELANALRASVELDVGDAVPAVTTVASAETLLDATERLLDAERRDAKRLKALARSMRPMEGVSLWPLLVELMLRDTEKHIGVLRFMRARLREDGHAQRKLTRQEKKKGKKGKST